MPNAFALPKGSADSEPFEVGVVNWLRQDEDVQAGIWRCTTKEQSDVHEAEFESNETVLILSGRVRVEQPTGRPSSSPRVTAHRSSRARSAGGLCWRTSRIFHLFLDDRARVANQSSPERIQVTFMYLVSDAGRCLRVRARAAGCKTAGCKTTHAWGVRK